VRAGGEHVRLGEAVLGGAIAGPGGDLVVLLVLGALVVHAADRDRVRVVAGDVADGIGCRAAAARRGDDDDAVPPRGLHV
jgi:hypothetical protein